MSFVKKEISDYVKDVPMRFSKTFSQLPNENHLNSILDLNPNYVEHLTALDFDYDFSVERIAIQDVERERERVLKEAEQKLKELELNNQLNDTQVKKPGKPIEDVINSSKPIQLTNLTVSNFVNKETPTSNSSNYNVYGHNAYPSTSNPNIYNLLNYNNSVIQEPIALNQQTRTTNSLTQQPQTPANLQTSTSSPNSNIQSNLNSQQKILNQNLTTTINYLPQNSLSTRNSNLHMNSQKIANTNLTIASPINLSPNNLSISQSNSNQLSKNHHSDNNLPQNSLQNHSDNLAQQTSLNNTIYNHQSSQFYSQSQQLQNSTGLSNYNSYSSPTTNYLTNPAPSVYDPTVNLCTYPLTNQMSSFNQNLNQISTNLTSVNQTIQPNLSNEPTKFYPQTTYNLATNYVPSSSNYRNGILVPQQSTITVNEPSQQIIAKKELTNHSNRLDNEKASIDSRSTKTNLLFNKSTDKKINVADFENSSSPFDDALLKSIDDKEELNNIFQQFYNGAK